MLWTTRGNISSKELNEELYFTWDTTNTKSSSTTATTTTNTLATKGNKGEGDDLRSLQFHELYTLLSEFKQAYGHVHVAKMMPLWHNNSNELDPLYKPEYKKLAPFLASVRSEQYGREESIMYHPWWEED